MKLKVMNGINITADDQALFGAMIIGFLVVFLIALAIGIVAYIIDGWAMMQVAKDKGLPVWTAWVPYVQYYLLFKATNISLWFLLCFIFLPINIISLFIEVSSILVGITWISILILMILVYVGNYRLCKEYNVRLLFFWLGIFIFPFYFVYIIKIGQEAKRRVSRSNEEELNPI